MIQKQAITMGMPVHVILIDAKAKEKDIENIFLYFHHIDTVFSAYKPTSEISQINSGLLSEKNASEEAKKIFSLCEKTKKETHGYFDMEKNGKIDPSGIVKGYAIHKAAEVLRQKGYTNFSIEIAGDIEVAGKNQKGEKWKIGIENPFNRKEIIKVLSIIDMGIATSGNYIRGKHIYNPIDRKDADEIVSITVVGPNVYEADRFATAAFAMGKKGIEFIGTLPGFEGYLVTKDKNAIYTSRFEKHVIQ